MFCPLAVIGVKSHTELFLVERLNYQRLMFQPCMKLDVLNFWEVLFKTWHAIFKVWAGKRLACDSCTGDSIYCCKLCHKLEREWDVFEKSVRLSLFLQTFSEWATVHPLATTLPAFTRGCVSVCVCGGGLTFEAHTWVLDKIGLRSWCLL